MINIRLGTHHTIKENSIKLIDAFKRHPDCCDEVWFSSEYGYPNLDVHKASAESITELSKLYKEAGIMVAHLLPLLR